MQRIELSEVKNLVEYEKLREAMRADIIELKQRRRLSVGDNLTFLFENRATVLFQIQEMVRTERIVLEPKIQDEVDAYNALIPEQDQLSATLFIEIPGIAALPHAEARTAVNRFQGIDRGCVFLRVGEISVEARFEGGHSKEEKLAGVQYLRFPISKELRSALQDPNRQARLVVTHANYRAEREISREVRAELLADLGAPSS